MDKGLHEDGIEDIIEKPQSKEKVFIYLTA